MSGYMEWRWRGQTIHEPIEKWAQAQGFPMVKVQETTKYLSLYPDGSGGKEVVEIEFIDMPEPFALGLPAFEGHGDRSVTRRIVNE